MWIVILLSFNCVNCFEYTTPNPDYSAGVLIQPNIPLLSSTVGTWRVSPSFSKGLVLNNDGSITGTPTEEYQNTYVVAFIPEGSSETQTATLFIKIWEKPNSLSYGIVKILTDNGINEEFNPVTGHRVSSYIFFNI